jgi:uncharacterized protein HemY
MQGIPGFFMLSFVVVYAVAVAVVRFGVMMQSVKRWFSPRFSESLPGKAEEEAS